MFKKLAHILMLAAILAGLFSLNPATPARAATLTVNTLADENDGSCVDGDCSLRDAVALANNSDVITFSVTGTITLSLGEITIDNNITINGPGPTNLTINANNASKIFYITINTVSISGLKLINGKSTYGGALENKGDLTLDNMVFDGNKASGTAPFYYAFGGAIANYKTLIITNSTFTNNTAHYLGGGIYSDFSTTTTLTNVMMTGNSAIGADFPSGGAISIASDNTTESSLTLTNSTISNNSSGYTGGGLYLQDYATANIQNTVISGNTVSGVNAENGGGIYVSPQVVLTLSGSVVSNNSSALEGAGIVAWSGSSITINRSTISNNTLTGTNRDGAGIHFGGATLSISASNISGNSGAAGGGGINVASGAVTVANSTFSANSAQYGGGINNFNGTLTVTNSTFTGNSASDTGGGIQNGNVLHITNTIIANSTGGDCTGLTANSSNNNLIEDAANACGLTNGLNGDITGSDPNLGSSTGSPAYFPLNAGSPAIDAGSNGICAAAPVSNASQNGVTRPKDGNSDTVATCDIGAFERDSFPTSATFGDVPMNHPYWQDIEILYANGFTGGCSASPLLFCPETTMDRAQGAVFMLRGLVGTSYVPPVEPFANPFGDSWSPGPWAQRWAQGMLDEGLTAGCSSSPLLYCPFEQMPRAQAAVFGMRLLNGSAYLPPAGTGTVFADINGSEWYAGWAEQAYANGLLPACGSSGGRPLFCPNSLVSRGLGAYMIVRARNLSMP